MDMTGERRIPAPREKVWAALNDPAVLRTCIPGCETLVRENDDTLIATAGVKIGPISAKFNGRVQLLDLNPPSSYRIQGEGQGGVAGFARGGADVRLAEDGAFTVLAYNVQANVGGRIAQLGGRLIDATAKSMADQFFNRFVAEVAGPEPGPGEISAADGPSGAIAAALTPSPPSPARASLISMIPAEPFGFPRVAWIGGALFALIFILIFGSYVF